MNLKLLTFYILGNIKLKNKTKYTCKVKKFRIIKTLKKSLKITYSR